MFKEENGAVSMRRVLAFILALAAIGLFVFGIISKKDNWFVFLPGIACLAGALTLLFFTTWNDITELTKAVRK
ncbi:MAG: hypothetical protein FWB86_11885 [Treponema sp.]|nr:hypothetical protein [Treponema sp.]